MDALIDKIKEVKDQHPDLTAFGFGGQGEINPTHVQICIQWLLAHDALDRRKTINNRLTSYGWKHKVEKDTGKYVSNGAFICAALYLGYKMKRLSLTSPNVYFNIREVEENALRK